MEKKKRFLTKLFTLVLLIALMLPTNVIAAGKTKMNASKKTVSVGKTCTVKLLNNKKKVKWSTSNKNIKIVSKSKKQAKIRGIKEGTSYLRAKVGKKTYKCRISVKKAPTPMPDPDTAQVPPEQPSKEELGNKILILEEYTLPDSIGWYTRHFMVVKNTSNVTVDVSTSSIAYAPNGTMVSAADASFIALGSGCTSVMYEAFETDKEIGRYSTKIEATESNYYKSVIQDLSYVKNDIEGGAIFQVTNNGKEPAEFVEGYALFFLGGKLVDFDSSYFTDSDYGLKPGDTITKQFNSYDDFDKIEFYLTGRR